MAPSNQPWELLRAYVDQKSEQAFSQLVSDHLDLVYSSALRQVRDRDLAQEVTQVVFIVLARRADTLRPGTILSAWLHKTTRYTALNLLRARRRRQAHERKAAEMATEFMRVDSKWPELSEMLDEGIARLNERDRAVIMLRFFEQKSIAETAGALGLSEDAAAMRVHRAVERLRAYFRDRRVDLPATALGGIIITNAVQAAPQELAMSVVAQAMAAVKGAAGTASAMAAADSVIHAMAMAQAKATALVLCAVLAAALVAGICANALLSPYLRPAAPPERSFVTPNRLGFLQLRARSFDRRSILTLGKLPTMISR